MSSSLVDMEQPRLSNLAQALRYNHRVLRYVDYRQAEKDCHRLAVKILGLYSREQLQECSFIAIPRGGFIVLGILAYILDLKPHQLSILDWTISNPLFIIDDCALSGVRFADFLARVPNSASDIVFAHLYSTAGLREAIVSEEPRVQHCLAAHDLHDYAREYYPDPDAYQAWQQRWQGRLKKYRYWHSTPEGIGFAWSEPDNILWNPATQGIEAGWRFYPPSLCLKNRYSFGLPLIEVSFMPLRIAPDVASGWFGEELWLCKTETEQIYKLQGIATEMWRALAMYGNLDVVAEYLLQEYEVEETTLRGDLDCFVAALLEHQLVYLETNPEP